MLSLRGVNSLLITGSNGFVGKSIIESISRLSSEDFPKELVLATRQGLSFKLPKNLGSISRVVQADLTEPWLFNTNASHVIHLAADGSRAPYSELANQDFFKVVQNFCSWLQMFEKIPKVFHASSGATLVSNSDELSRAARSVKKEFVEIRLQAEDLLKQSVASEAKDLVIGKLFTFSGRNLLPKRNYAVVDFIRGALESNSLTVTGHPDTVRSYLHEEEMSEWILRALLNTEIVEEIQIGSAEAVTISQLAQFIAEITSSKVTYTPNNLASDVYLPNDLYSRAKLGVKQGLDWKSAVQDMVTAVRQEKNAEH
jgi:nucleoside-diphosphate-sugar epimerase